MWAQGRDGKGSIPGGRRKGRNCKRREFPLRNSHPRHPPGMAEKGQSSDQPPVFTPPQNTFPPWTASHSTPPLPPLINMRQRRFAYRRSQPSVLQWPPQGSAIKRTRGVRQKVERKEEGGGAGLGVRRRGRSEGSGLTPRMLPFLGSLIPRSLAHFSAHSTALPFQLSESRRLSPPAPPMFLSAL